MDKTTKNLIRISCIFLISTGMAATTLLLIKIKKEMNKPLDENDSLELSEDINKPKEIESDLVQKESKEKQSLELPVKEKKTVDHERIPEAPSKDLIKKLKFDSISEDPCTKYIDSLDLLDEQMPINEEKLSFAQKVDELANLYLKCVDNELNKIK
ncbi:hypothetical protein [Prochlorococcus sp. MIT 1300]|uniref:hypothetical protein n=1 Tax=Prochlorococcus sp. MIT 1300 TaxID=3096218 RepID=UPI002A7622A1|nr:hypothetical protein [Prochlorococcus sp. MIT 1300]